MGTFHLLSFFSTLDSQAPLRQKKRHLLKGNVWSSFTIPTKRLIHSRNKNKAQSYYKHKFLKTSIDGPPRRHLGPPAGPVWARLWSGWHLSCCSRLASHLWSVSCLSSIRFFSVKSCFPEKLRCVWSYLEVWPQEQESYSQRRISICFVEDKAI